MHTLNWQMHLGQLKLLTQGYLNTQTGGGRWSLGSNHWPADPPFMCHSHPIFSLDDSEIGHNQWQNQALFSLNIVRQRAWITNKYKRQEVSDPVLLVVNHHAGSDNPPIQRLSVCKNLVFPAQTSSDAQADKEALMELYGGKNIDKNCVTVEHTDVWNSSHWKKFHHETIAWSSNL